MNASPEQSLLDSILGVPSGPPAKASGKGTAKGKTGSLTGMAAPVLRGMAHPRGHEPSLKQAINNKP